MILWISWIFLELLNLGCLIDLLSFCCMQVFFTIWRNLSSGIATIGGDVLMHFKWSYYHIICCLKILFRSQLDMCYFYFKSGLSATISCCRYNWDHLISRHAGIWIANRWQYCVQLNYDMFSLWYLPSIYQGSNLSHTNT